MVRLNLDLCISAQVSNPDFISLFFKCLELFKHLLPILSICSTIHLNPLLRPDLEWYVAFKIWPSESLDLKCSRIFKNKISDHSYSYVLLLYLFEYLRFPCFSNCYILSVNMICFLFCSVCACLRYTRIAFVFFYFTVGAQYQTFKFRAHSKSGCFKNWFWNSSVLEWWGTTLLLQWGSE